MNWTKKIGIIGVYFGDAGSVKGAELGAKILRNFCLSHDNTKDIGTLYPIENKISVEKKLLKVSIDLSTRIYSSLKKGMRCFSIGGDHSIALGTIVGASNWAHENNKNIGVIYIDAHTDCNIPKSSLTGNLHGMPIAFAMGRGDCELSNVAEHPLHYNNILYIGARSIDPAEKEFLDSTDIKVVSSSEINKSPDLEKVYRSIEEFVKSNCIDIIHLSIDIDVVDPALAPGTGVPEKGGISEQAFYDIISYILNNTDVCAVDLVEYNPILDSDDKTKKICKEVCRINLRTLQNFN